MATLRELVRTPAGRFVARYAVILTVGFTILALKPINDSVVNRYTTFVAHEARLALVLFGDEAKVEGQVLSTPRFAVAIHNGCNGLEAILVFVCGVLAFPATTWRRVVGVALGLVAIQGFNLVRIVALFYTGIYKPEWFGASHVLVWQSLVIVFAVSLWVLWVQRYARPTT
ncbi:MAG: exosortase H [Thermoanaerobaculaceae bacterium]|nr:exosortase H [Thermoanaerobaculaceae bacterium]MDI9623235.1 exosortase H [Acidobacteriota bacterium]NLH11300.1 exosortase H [Holophagae bacterium]HPW56605.1 exosortase H [Thermoanaerobaculaceae bacterium]